MKKKLTLVAVLALALSGCATGPESVAQRACEDEIRSEIPADKLDFSDFEVSNMSDALFEEGVTGERDHSEDFMTGTGTVISWNGSVEKKHTVICMVTVIDGEPTDLSVTAN